jgi:ornithine decarboxylase
MNQVSDPIPNLNNPTISPPNYLSDQANDFPDQSNEQTINDSFLPSFIKKHNVSVVSNRSSTPDLIKEIIEKYGPPDAFYIVNIGDILRRVKLWKKLFPKIDPYYAVKSNCSPVICELLSNCGLGFDVASIEEINIVKNAAKNTDTNNPDVIFAHPVKPINSIVYARTVDVNLLVIDSEHELYKIKLYHPHSQVLIRLKVDDKESECRFSEKFGVDEEDINDILDLAKKMDLNVVGTSFHVGSNCKNAKQYYSAIKTTHDVFTAAKEKGFNFNVIDIGGGFSGNSTEYLLEEISKEVHNALTDLFDYENCLGLRVMSEPGRFFCTNSHTLVLNVLGKKVKVDKSGEKCQTIYLNDGLYGSFSAITYDYQKPTIIPYNNDDVIKYKTKIEGCSCDSRDIICSSVMLPELEISDLVYVEEFGAYTIASSSQFNGFSVTKFFYVFS